MLLLKPQSNGICMATTDHCSPVLTFACACLLWRTLCSDSVHASGLAASVRRHGRTRRNDHFRHRHHRHLPDQQVSVIEELVFRTLCHRACHGPPSTHPLPAAIAAQTFQRKSASHLYVLFFFFSFPLWLRINRCLVLIKTYNRTRPNFHSSNATQSRRAEATR